MHLYHKVWFLVQEWPCLSLFNSDLSSEAALLLLRKCQIHVEVPLRDMANDQVPIHHGYGKTDVIIVFLRRKLEYFTNYRGPYPILRPRMRLMAKPIHQVDSPRFSVGMTRTCFFIKRISCNKRTYFALNTISTCAYQPDFTVCIHTHNWGVEPINYGNAIPSTLVRRCWIKTKMAYFKSPLCAWTPHL